MAQDLRTMYLEVFNAFKTIFVKKPGASDVQTEFNKIWQQEVKNKPKSEGLEAAQKLKETFLKKYHLQKKKNFCSFYSKPTSVSQSNSTPVPNKGVSNSKNIESSDASGGHQEKKNGEIQPQESSRSYKQQKISKDIERLSSERAILEKAKSAGFNNAGNNDALKKINTDLATAILKLKQLKDNSARQKLFRKRRSDNLGKACESYPGLAKTLRLNNSSGQPSLNVKQPELLRTIAEIAQFGASAEGRRCSELLYSCLTLDDLKLKLEGEGFTISRSALYLRLLPKKNSGTESKRHVSTVPVRLIKPQNDLHASHSDTKFCIASIRSLETLASLLEPEEVAFISQDDKARVPIGVTAANKAAPFLMHLQYKVKLPDHDYVVALRHKLIPSVYAGIEIKSNQMGKPEAVGYSGPTYVAIRSGKHSASSAGTHAADLDRLFELSHFKNILFSNSNQKKPVLMLSVDGGPDENPRYKNVIQHAIGHFIKNDFDAVFIFTNAPGRSAYNRVERRMAPLSRRLTGVVLEHEHFGSHLNSQRKTTDEELEKKNFKYAGQTLAQIWNELEIDNFAVFSEYIDPGTQEFALQNSLNDEWYMQHVRESRYLLQVVKCGDESCCRKFRSSIRTILPERFLPAPYPILQTSTGFVVPSNNSDSEFDYAPLLLKLALKQSVKPQYRDLNEIPYDLYCPSVSKNDGIKKKICFACEIYFNSAKNLYEHKKFCNPSIAKSFSCKKINPSKMLARRGDEILCRYINENFDEEVVEWVDTDCIVNSDKWFPQGDEYLNEGEKWADFPIVNKLDEWYRSDFEDDK